MQASLFAEISPFELEDLNQQIRRQAFDNLKQKTDCRLLVENNLYEGLAYLSAEQLQSEQGLLEEAVRLGHFETAQVLIGKGFDVNYSSQGDSSALQLAQESQDLRLTRLLLQAGANDEDLTSETRRKLNTDNEQPLQPIDLVRANLREDLSNFSVDELKQPIDNHGQTLLHEAAKYGHLDCVKLLTNKGLDIEARNGREQTPLHLAAKYGHTPIVSHLLEQGAQYEVKDNHDLTPNDLAKKNDCDSVQRLLEEATNLDELRHDPNKRNQQPLVCYAVKQGYAPGLKTLGLEELAQVDESSNFNALDYAIDEGNTQAAKVLLEKAGSKLLKMDEQKGKSALHRAVLADSNNKELIELLVEYGWQVNQQDDFLQTPLHIASQFGKEAAVRCLLEKGADPHIQDKENKKPQLQPIGFVRDNLHEHLRNFSFDELKQPINNYGQTLLHEAAKYGHLDCVKLLTKQGLNIEARNGREQTPLHLAAQHGHIPIVDYLLEQGAPFEVGDRSSQMPYNLVMNSYPASKLSLMNYAINLGCTQVAKVLLEKAGSGLLGMDGQKYKRALHRAVLADSNNKELIELLVKYGWGVDQKDNWLKTPLHDASQFGKEASVQCLLEKGADPDQKDNWLKTPLHDASQFGKEASVQCLLEKGADPDVQDENNNKPQDLAANQNISQLINTFKLFPRQALNEKLENIKPNAQRANPSSSYGFFATSARKQQRVAREIKQLFDAIDYNKGFDNVVDQFVNVIKAMAQNRGMFRTATYGWTNTLNQFYNEISKDDALQPLQEQLETLKAGKTEPGLGDKIDQCEFDKLDKRPSPSSQQSEPTSAARPGMTGTR